MNINHQSALAISSQIEIRRTAFVGVFETRGRERLCLTCAYARFDRHITCINTALKRARRYRVASEMINAHSEEALKGRVVPITAPRSPSASSGDDRSAEGVRSREIVKLQRVRSTTDFRTVACTRLVTCTLRYGNARRVDLITTP